MLVFLALTYVVPPMKLFAQSVVKKYVGQTPTVAWKMSISAPWLSLLMLVELTLSDSADLTTFLVVMRPLENHGVKERTNV